MFFESFNLQQSFAHNPPSIDCEGVSVERRLALDLTRFIGLT